MQRDRQDHGSRSSKPATIHSYAQSGDLLGFQRLLRGDPSLLNERNPVVRFHYLILIYMFHMQRIHASGSGFFSLLLVSVQMVFFKVYVV
jgi:hypothetical protein